MDINDSNLYNGNGIPFLDLPLGFGMSRSLNETALQGYAGLTEAQKEDVILHCKDAKTKDQMQKVVDSLAPGTDIQEVYEEEKESFS